LVFLGAATRKSLSRWTFDVLSFKKEFHVDKPSRDEALLMSVAESVGSTLGTLAAKATAFQKAITPGAKPRKRRSVKAAVNATAKRNAPKRKSAARKRGRRARSKS
jgi:hypothetical protein